MGPGQTDRSGAFDYRGKAVLVTGGMRGIGRGIAEQFLSAGADVMVCGRTEPGEVGPPVTPERQAAFVRADVRDAAEATAAVSTTIEQFGRLDVLVNNAGGSPAAPAADASPRFIAQVVALNLLAPFYCAQAANLRMQEDPAGGSIINIASISGTRPSPGTAAYGAAKAGLINLTKTLAIEWAPKVRVNCIVAGLIATEAGDLHYGGAAALQAVAATVPMGRMGTPTDVAGACLFLGSPLAAFVSGAAVEVHGGGERPPYLDAVEQALGHGA